MIKLEMAKLETAKLQKKCDKVVGCVMLVLAGSCCDEAGDGEARDACARLLL